jgi:K+-sensing histidine kinase KdpD
MKTPNDHPTWKIAAAVGISFVLVCYLDYLTGYQLTVSLLYLIPIFLCGWFCARLAVVCTALLIGTGFWITDKFSGHIYPHESFRLWNSFNRFAVFLIVGLIIHRLRKVLDEKERINQALKKSLEDLAKFTEEIQKLQSGLQIVCAWTKRIKVGEQWLTPEEFLKDKFHLKLTHTISPEAYQEIVGQLKDLSKPPSP